MTVLEWNEAGLLSFVAGFSRNDNSFFFLFIGRLCDEVAVNVCVNLCEVRSVEYD